MTDEHNHQSDAEQSSDLSLTAIIQALDDGTPMPDAQEPNQQDSFDPNATINYQQAGSSYPEFPFADERNDINTSAASASPTYTSVQRPTAQPAAGGSTAAPLNREAATAQNYERSSRAGAGASQTPRISANTTRAARSTFNASDGVDYRSNFKPVNVQRSGYKIRGGGRKYNPRSPILIALCAILVVVGVGAMVVGVKNVFSSFSSTSSGVEFDLSTTETREAIDSRLPVLLSYIDYGIEDTTAVISETQYVYTNDRHTPDSPDASAANIELVSMPQEMSVEQMEGYYSGSYNAYLPEELTQYFNGSYVFDLARGDLGSWNKLRYVNLNASSIEDEMAHLAEYQGLTGDTVTISAQGVDSRGNLVIQGQKVIPDTEIILYFKIAACPFKDLYTAQSLTDASVYITCTLANYDFYTGADEITPVE